MARAKRQLTSEQREAAIARLAAARAKKGHDGSATVHPDIRDMDPDSPIHWKKVRVWIKEIQSELKGKKSYRDSKDARQRFEYHSLETYLGNLKRYLDSGIYLDHRYGRLREGKVLNIVRVMAYDDDGYPKRNVGYYYPDIADVWTKEMDDELNKTRARGPATRTSVHDEEDVLETG